MNFFERLLRRKPKSRPVAGWQGDEASQAEAARAALSGKDQTPGGRFPKIAGAEGGKPEVLTRATRAKVDKESTGKAGPAPAVNIWELEDDGTPAPSLRNDPAPRRRQNRTKTRMLGFEPQDADVVPLFEEPNIEDEVEAIAKIGVAMFPTGWLIIKQGAGRGAAFPLLQGVSQIGRGTDQTVSLDFGDMSISRSNHAAIAYDPVTHQFHVGHGGKSNLVRLNGKPLLTTEAVVDGDEIQIGETTLLLKVLCTADFNWSAAQAGGDGHDMAIA